MHQVQRSWVRSQHPSAQWNLRGSRWSSAEYSTEKNPPKKYFKKRPSRFEIFILLPGTPLTGIEFRKRLPCGEAERARKAIRTFFLLRQLSLSLQNLPETSLPLLSPPDAAVMEGDLLDLNNSGQRPNSQQQKNKARAVFRIRDVYPWSELCYFPDPNFFHPGSRICIKEFKYFKF